MVGEQIEVRVREIPAPIASEKKTFAAPSTMSSTVRLRSGVEDIARLKKKQKRKHVHKSDFAEGLFDDANVNRLNSEYHESKPFLHAVVDKLFQDDLLSLVKDECLKELCFTEKQTDIYRVRWFTLHVAYRVNSISSLSGLVLQVFQTGDLASLSYLSADQLALLPNLLKLRNALYSPEFRAFVRKVTGCGPLSTHQDMSVNSYRQGCHLLNHDDVIG